MKKTISISKRILLFPFILSLTLLASAQETEGPNKESAVAGETEHFGSYKPNVGFKLVNTEYGDVNFKIFTYVRYLNQQGLNATYTDSFGQTSDIDRRQDIQLNKVNIQFLGWFMNPKFRYLFYIWTNNTAQGLGSQVVVGGNLTYAFIKHFTLGVGINALPGVRSTEGSFPFWLTLDNRLMADEFFRPSYTTGIWAKGEVVKRLNYSVMLGNNLSQLGVDAGQLDDGINTFSAALTYFPTTGEYGLNSNFGDFEDHQKAATRIGLHFTRSDEDRQGQPRTDAFENVQIRLSDGNVIFEPNLFGDGIQIERATYQMACFDVGAKYRGFALEAEFYWRLINGLTGRGVDSLNINEFNDNGYQVQGSGMIIPKLLQLYATWSQVFGEYGDPREFRAGLNYYPWKNHMVRANAEYIYQDKCPVGGLSLPYAVGGTGSIFHLNLQVNF